MAALSGRALGVEGLGMGGGGELTTRAGSSVRLGLYAGRRGRNEQEGRPLRLPEDVASDVREMAEESVRRLVEYGPQTPEQAQNWVELEVEYARYIGLI